MARIKFCHILSHKNCSYKSTLKYKFMKVKIVIKVLETNGWYLARTRGSHRQYKHPSKPGTVTISGKPSVDVPIGTLKSIWRQAKIDEDKI